MYIYYNNKKSRTYSDYNNILPLDTYFISVR